MNEHDSEILAGLMETMGYVQAENIDVSDIIVVNTCCVRESAENKILGFLGSLKRIKITNPDLIVCVGGCMVQKPGEVDTIQKMASHVDVIFGTHNLYRLPYLIAERINSGKPVVEIWDTEGEIKEQLPVRRSEKLKAQVTIMFGCNNFCTYCIVPYVRGRERSRNPYEIKGEIEKLGQEGFKEIMLLGQNVNSYGTDLEEPFDFADLLKLLDPIDGIERIRYMTSHPRDFSNKLIDTIFQCKKVCEHFHLPIQAGGNRILKLMNRGYTREIYLELVEKIRAKFPHSSITTDIIVGFPGETDDDFDETLDLIKEVRFDAAYTFLYSPRSGTPAADFLGQVPMAAKKERLKKLMELQNKISLEINQKLLGETLEVMVEGTSKNKKEMLTGRTRTNKIVNFPYYEDLTGKFVNLTIVEAKTWHLEGKLISQK